MSPASLPEIAFSLGQSGNTLFIATGHPHDREVERLPLGKDDCGPLVLDSITAWVLAKLDLLTCVANTFGGVLIPVSAIDELRAWSERIGEAASESMTLHSEGDRIVRTDHTEDARNSMRAEIDEVVARIDEGVTSVGIGIPEFEDTQVRQMADLLGDQFDTVSVATREGGTVLSLDLRFRQVAREIAGLNAVGIDALLDQLLEVEAIDTEQHAKSMMDLAVQGCGVLSVNAGLLLAAFRADQSDNKRGFQILVRFLGGRNAEPISHLTVAAAFADLTFQELPALKAQSATGHVLRALVRLNGIAADQIVEAFSARCRDYRVRRYAREWTRGHFFHCSPSTSDLSDVSAYGSK
ncbi:PIN domain-containing protein [Cognatishimia maritima]|uniref:PIN domain-containing protein n=1 Tax=Cognatishimia maritima TaxID=870908 RepID=UPI0031010E61